MIKKILGSILVVGLGFVGFSSAITQQVGLTSVGSSLDDNYEITALAKGRALTNYLGQGKGLFAFSSSRLLFWATNGFPYLYLSDSIQGYFSKYSLCSYSISSNNTMSTSSCTTYDLDNNSLSSLQNFFSTVSNGDYFYYYVSSTPYRFCWSSSSVGKAFCIQSNNLAGSESYNGLTFSNISASIYQNGPAGGSSNSGTGGIVITGNVVSNVTTGSDLITYYEQSPYYKYNKSICYVGTNDLTSVYEDGIHYYEGKGKNIFELYNHLYGTGSTGIHEVSTFINSWWINYMTWFMGENRDHNGDVMYNSVYTVTGSYQVWENLTNPFLGNLSAIYFMASNVTSYGSYSTQGEDIATYCYYKLGSPEDNGYDNVADDSNPVLWENAGIWSEVVNKTYNEYRADYQLPSNSNNDIGDYNSGFWANLGVYNNTGQKVDFNSSFRSFYAKFTSKLDQVTGLQTRGLIPDYILGFLILVCLFKILRKY